jgi:hypothetical protein
MHSEIDVLVGSAKLLWGDPTSQTANELRFGKHGSKSVSLEKLTWFDHEENEGGGWLKIAKRAGYPLKNGHANPKIVDAYIYRKPDGTPHQEVIRLNHDGKKTFRQLRFENGVAVPGVKDIELFPYNLHLIEQYQASRIIVVEGEKDADTLTALGFIATTNPGGSKNWPDHFAKYFIGRDVIVLPDNDVAGRAHAKKVVENIISGAKSVRLIELAGLPEKGDVTDWIKDGNTADGLKEIILAWPAILKPLPLGALTIGAFAAEYQALDYIVDGILEEGRLYSLTAPSGTGKTAVAIHLAEMVALGQPFGNHECKASGVLFLAGENPSDVRVRVMASIERNPKIKDAPIFFIKNAFNIEENIGNITKMLELHPEIKLVMVDTLQAFYRGDDSNSNTQMVAFARALRKISELGIVVLVMAHPTKSPTKERNEPYGGGAFVNEIDGNLALWKNDDGTIDFYWCKKFRGHFEPFSVELKRIDVMSAKNSAGIPSQTILANTITDTRANELFVESIKNETKVLRLYAMANGDAISYSDIARKLGWVLADKPQKVKVGRCIEKLMTERLLGENRYGIYITKKGREDLDNNGGF